MHFENRIPLSYSRSQFAIVIQLTYRLQRKYLNCHANLINWYSLLGFCIAVCHHWKVLHFVHQDTNHFHHTKSFHSSFDTSGRKYLYEDYLHKSFWYRLQRKNLSIGVNTASAVAAHMHTYCEYFATESDFMRHHICKISIFPIFETLAKTNWNDDAKIIW